MSYRAALAVSWALTWRLALAHVVVLSILLLLLIAFLGAARNDAGLFVGVGELVLGWLMAWPFVIKRVLAPQAVLPKAQWSRFRVRYDVAVVLGVVCDVISMAPAAAVYLGLGKSGGAASVLVFLVVRTFLVLPFGVRALLRRVPELV